MNQFMGRAVLVAQPNTTIETKLTHEQLEQIEQALALLPLASKEQLREFIHELDGDSSRIDLAVALKDFASEAGYIVNHNSEEERSYCLRQAQSLGDSNPKHTHELYKCALYLFTLQYCVDDYINAPQFSAPELRAQQFTDHLIGDKKILTREQHDDLYEEIVNHWLS